MSTTIYLHGPHTFTTALTGAGPDAFASLSTGDASLFLHTRADCDALVKAALAARDLLPDPVLPPYTEVPGIAHCAPGDCVCGGHVDAEGVFHAATVTA